VFSQQNSKKNFAAVGGLNNISINVNIKIFSVWNLLRIIPSISVALLIKYTKYIRAPRQTTAESLDKKYDFEPATCHKFFNLNMILLYLNILNQSLHPH
jgi:hypothetical protein